jgi:hypothetical protein
VCFKSELSWLAEFNGFDIFETVQCSFVIDAAHMYALLPGTENETQVDWPTTIWQQRASFFGTEGFSITECLATSREVSVVE